MVDKKKVLQIGPDILKSKGGMVTVIHDIFCDEDMNEKFEIDVFPSYRSGNCVYRGVYSILAYIRFLRKYKEYDVFHIHIASYMSTFRKTFYIKRLKKANKKVICHIHGGEYLQFFGKLNPKKKEKVANVLNSADVVIALSDDWRNSFQSIIGLKNCIAIPNGIDMQMFKQAVCDVNIHKETFVLLGRLCEQKGVYDLIRAIQMIVADIPNIKLYLAGDGEIEKVQQLVKRKGLENNVEVVGWVDFYGKIELLKKCSTVVLPSHNEGLPMAILEGMAAGKAIISTRVGAIPEVIGVENGILITPGDVEALTNALVKCSTDAEMISAMSIENINKINNEFSMKIMHEKLAHYYSEV